MQVLTYKFADNLAGATTTVCSSMVSLRSSIAGGTYVFMMHATYLA